MNKTSVLTFFIGAILGVVIGVGYMISVDKPNIQAEGFRDITYADNHFNLGVVKRIDADNVEVVKNIQVPADGFLKSYSAMQQLVNKLVEEGVLVQGPSAADASSETPQE